MCTLCHKLYTVFTMCCCNSVACLTLALDGASSSPLEMLMASSAASSAATPVCGFSWAGAFVLGVSFAWQACHLKDFLCTLQNMYLQVKSQGNKVFAIISSHKQSRHNLY